MPHAASPELSASATSGLETPDAVLDETLAELRAHAEEFARLGAGPRSALLKACLPRLRGVARSWVEAGCTAKDLRIDAPEASDEWYTGPYFVARNIRLLARSLDQIAENGKPALSPRRFGRSPDGRTTVRVFPTDMFDAALFLGFSCHVRLLEGVDEAATRERQAGFYGRSEPEGRLALVLGAGNVSSIPAMDVLTKMFIEGAVCLLKLSPVNEYIGPFLTEVLGPLCEAGFLRVVTGGAEASARLVHHEGVDEVHITGSDRTHDLIVWGPPGAERDRRMAQNDPVLKKPITSELGTVTPLIVVPGTYSDRQLSFVAENIATAVVNNASFNCNSVKMLVNSKEWPQREDFLGKIRSVLARFPPRKAYYPGAVQRFESLVAGRPGQVPQDGAGEGTLPWATAFGLDEHAQDERLFDTEPFCSILSETALEAASPADFLRSATDFCNDRLWGTLSANIVVQPKQERDPVVAAALNDAIAELRYGAVSINHWSALVFAIGSAPWGGHPSSTPADIQGGLGWVHNTYMLDGVEKAVLRGPLVVFPKPPWFVTHRRAHRVAERLTYFEVAPGLRKLPAIGLEAARG
ncbi:MAG: aldehyde dehydrogenase family protein [Actinomycetota bacterium]